MRDLRHRGASRSKDPTRLSGRLLIGSTAGLLALRLWQISAADLGQDDAQFLAAARHQLETGEWATVSPAMGTLGIRYGPTIVWFYGIVQWLVGASPLAARIAMCAVLTCVHVLLVRAVCRVFGLGRAWFVGILVFVGSSPYLHHWSRLSWDQSVMVCATAAVVLLSSDRPPSMWRATAVGALLGLALASHPMALPFVLSVVGVLLWELRRDRGQVARTLGPLLAAATVVLLPYLGHLAGDPPHADSARPEVVAALGHAAETPAVSTAHGVEYFFDASWTELRAWLGPAEPLLAVRPLVLLAVFMVTLLGLGAAVRSDAPARRRVALLAASTWAITAVLFALRALGPNPHYQFAAWWVVPVGLASAIDAVRRTTWRPALVLVPTIVVLQLTFSLAWVGFVVDGHGTRDRRQGPSLREQEGVAAAICDQGAGPTLVRNDTVVAREALHYLVAIRPDCGVTALTVCSGRSCTADHGRPPDLAVIYRTAAGGALAVDTDP